MNPTGADGYEEHPLLNTRVRDVASGGQGLLTAVVHELYGDGRVVRIAHIRPASGVEFTTVAENVLPAVSTHITHDKEHIMSDNSGTGSSGGGSGSGGGNHGGGNAPISTPPPPPPSNPDTSTPPGGGKHR